MTLYCCDGETKFSKLSALMDLRACCQGVTQVNPGTVFNNESKQSAKLVVRHW